MVFDFVLFKIMRANSKDQLILFYRRCCFTFFHPLEIRTITFNLCVLNNMNQIFNLSFNK